MNRSSAAMMLFGIQQLKNALGAATDSATYINCIRESLDSVTNAITSQLSTNARPALESVTNLGADLVDRTVDTLAAPVFDPQRILETASIFTRQTADRLTAAAGAGGQGPSANEPQPATALTSESGRSDPMIGNRAKRLTIT